MGHLQAWVDGDRQSDRATGFSRPCRFGRESQSADSFQDIVRESERITKNILIDTYKPVKQGPPHCEGRFSAGFPGACGGVWGELSTYRGELPDFGGMLFQAGRRRILVDPGPRSAEGLKLLGIDASTLDGIIVTHRHFDANRDLDRMISERRWRCPENPLCLLAAKSVIADSYLTSGLPKSCITELACEKEYRIGKRLTLRTPPVFHPELSHLPSKIPSLDITYTPPGRPPIRCLYLGDTEYRHDLARQYSTNISEAGQIDLLILNIKTLNALPYESGALKGYTRRHLGWKGAVQLTRELRKFGALASGSVVVLRQFGIETVSCKDLTDNILLAQPERLRTIQQEFQEKTGEKAVIPHGTWITIESRKKGSPEIGVHHSGRYGLPAECPKDSHCFGECFYYSSPAMAEIVERITRLFDGYARMVILIKGETGVGKSFFAKAVHQEAVKRGKATGDLFVANCATLNPQLAVSQLFGHAKGTFTGASGARPGWFEMAQHGTLLLEEIGELNDDIQAELLTVLEDKKYNRLGDLKEIAVTQATILTTNQGLEKLRSDLAGRVDEIIDFPPLAKRKEDIDAIVGGLCRQDRYPSSFADTEMLTILKQFSWPTNVRGIIHTLDAVLRSRDFTPYNMEKEAQRHQRLASRTHEKSPQISDDLDVEERQILKALANREGRELTRSEIQNRLTLLYDHPGQPARLSKGVINARLSRLSTKGWIRRIGAGPKTRYRLIRPLEDDFPDHSFG